MADKRKAAEKPSKNRTSAGQQRKQQSDTHDQTNQSHRSDSSVVEGGQNQQQGEPHYGYGSDQGQSQSGKK